jgi:hypothetical protein
LSRTPFLIPDLEASDVHLNGPPAKRRHQQLVLREHRVAGVAHFAIARNTPGRSDAILWQATVVKLAPDEEAEGFVVQHMSLSGLDNETRQIHLGLNAGASTREAEVQAAERSTDG